MNVSRLLHQRHPDFRAGGHGLLPHRARNRLVIVLIAAIE